ncbi:MAG: TraR/DksA C4-type zinc finger protein [Chitinophagaceae bacterium]
MATKKKVATKVAVKKAAHPKKAEPAKQAVKPVVHTATSKSLPKHGTKPAEKKVVVSGAHTKKVATPISKHIEKPSTAKPSKAPSKTAIATKTEQVKNTPQKLENKSQENKSQDNKVIHPSTPPRAKKKEASAAKPAKVTMPEIKTKTVRKYEPDFTKSVLDTPMHDHSAPSQRYSDTDLTEFRDLINKKLEAAKKELNYLQGLITRKDEMGGDESDNRYMTMEDGSISMEREQLSQMASRQITFIDHLDKAIMRIENKTYGICRVTGKLIDKARLRAVPHATLSIEAKQTMNK